MTDDEILKKYELKIKKGIDEVIAEHQITDPARIKRVAQRCKDGFIIGYKEGRMRAAKKLLAMDWSVDEIIEITNLSLNKLKS